MILGELIRAEYFIFLGKKRLCIDSTLTHFLCILGTYKYLRVPSVYTLKFLLTSMKLEKKISSRKVKVVNMVGSPYTAK
jgi:hypothetical protein